MTVIEGGLATPLAEPRTPGAFSIACGAYRDLWRHLGMLTGMLLPAAVACGLAAVLSLGKNSPTGPGFEPLAALLSYLGSALYVLGVAAGTNALARDGQFAPGWIVASSLFARPVFRTVYTAAVRHRRWGAALLVSGLVPVADHVGIPRLGAIVGLITLLGLYSSVRVSLSVTALVWDDLSPSDAVTASVAAADNHWWTIALANVLVWCLALPFAAVGLVLAAVVLGLGGGVIGAMADVTTSDVPEASSVLLAGSLVVASAVWQLIGSCALVLAMARLWTARREAALATLKTSAADPLAQPA